MNPDVYLAARDIIRKTGWIPKNPHEAKTGENCLGTALSKATSQFEGTDHSVLTYHRPLLQVCEQRYGIADFIHVNDHKLKDEDDAVELLELAYKWVKNGGLHDGGDNSGYGQSGSSEADRADWDFEPR